MAAASVIVVLAWVPHIEIKKFEPLGFDFSEGGELSVWGLLVAVLVYYAIRFSADCWTDYNGWRGMYRKSLNLAPDDANYGNVTNRHVRRLNRKCWGLDVTPPALMFVAALAAAYQQVAPLVMPPPAPPLP